MENVIVEHKGELWTCDLPVRRTLFPLYQKSDPNFMVYIRKENCFPKLIKVSEVKISNRVLIKH